jgi:hypothetical protein
LNRKEFYLREPKADTSSFPKSRSTLETIWAIIRLPIALLILIAFHRQIQALVMDVFGLGRVTLFVINVLSTPVTRAAYFLAVLAALLAVTVLTRSCSLTKAYLTVSSIGAVLFIGGCLLTSRPVAFAVPALLILFCNLLPSNLTSKFTARSTRTFLFAAIGISEVLLFWRHIRWIWWERGQDILSDRMPRLQWALPGIAFASAASAALLNGWALVPIEQTLRSSSEVRVIAKGDDFNGMLLDPTNEKLFVSGHGLNHIRRYDLKTMPPSFTESIVPTGYAQEFAYDPSADELYVFDEPNGQLIYIDGQSLSLKKKTDLKGVSPGDASIAFDPNTATILVSSEADEQVGIPFYLVDRASGEILSTLAVDGGGLLLDQGSSIAYLDYFRRKSVLLMYDVKLRKVTRETELGAHADRMALWEKQNELLVTLPLESRIARFDASTLESKGSIPTVFGVRTIAIDKGSNLLLSGSLATGYLEVIDLSSGKRLKKFYLGPWLRRIQIIPDQGLAYVSANGAIFQVRYK